ncbi:MAG TPA: hypothetical protein VII00_05400 [bacterium]
MRCFIVYFLFVFLSVSFPAHSSEFMNSGYFRVRAMSFQEKDFLSDNFLESRLRWEPEIKLAEKLSIFMQADFDGLWGGAAPVDFRFNRAWLSIETPAGLLQVGRMPSEWGRGVFTNAGIGFDDMFGDNYAGDTFDRILLSTKPLGKESALTTALIFDKISSGRSNDLDDDLNEMVLVFFASGVRGMAGVYGGYRVQPSTATEAFFSDGYFRFSKGIFTAEAEGVYIYGHSRAFQTPLLKGKYFIDQAGASGSIKIEAGIVEPVIEAGFASGDNNAFNRHITQFTFHTDYNVGLILYERVLADLTDIMVQEFSNIGEIAPPGYDIFRTGGGVTNSWYIYPAVIVRPRRDLDVILAGLYARAIFPFIDIVKFMETNTASNLMGGRPSRDLGWEVDLSAEWTAAKNWTLGVQSGYFYPGEAFRDASGIKHPVYAVQARFTLQF